MNINLYSHWTGFEPDLYNVYMNFRFNMYRTTDTNVNQNSNSHPAR